MKNLIKILPNIYGVKVSLNSCNHHIAGGKLIHQKSADNWESVMFLWCEYEIIGTITKDDVKISFSASRLGLKEADSIFSILPKNLEFEKLLILYKL